MNKSVIVLLISILISAFVAIQGCNSQSEQPSESAEIIESNGAEVDHTAALALLQTNCFSCHNPDMGIEQRIAPPIFKIREHYFDENISKEDFVSKVVNFINDPTAENSIMPGAVRNFGLMPKQTFKEDDLKTIAAYMYDNDLASDRWYKDWEEFNQTKQETEEDLSYEDLGLKIANGTKSQLGKNLLEALQKHGAPGAVEFCNTRAMPLTDSMSTVYNSKVKRVSDKPRNPENRADKNEIAIINAFKTNIINKEKLNARLDEKGGIITGYYPIITNQMCLRCHGNENEDILPETVQKINKLYPTDEAVGYKDNEIRGLFVIEMNKKQ